MEPKLRAELAAIFDADQKCGGHVAARPSPRDEIANVTAIAQGNTVKQLNDVLGTHLARLTELQALTDQCAANILLIKKALALKLGKPYAE